MPMNDSELEDQLRALAPAAPSADLAARIEREFAASPPIRQTAGVIARPTRPSILWKWVRDLGWAGAGAAAALGAVALYSSAQRQPAQQPTAPTMAAAEPARVKATASVAAPVEEQAFEPAETSRELVAVN